MRRWRGSLVVITVAVAGALGTFLASLALGMRAEVAGISRALLPAAMLTVLAATIGGRILARLSLRAQFVGVAVLAAAVAIANVFVLSQQMFVSDHDAALVTVVVVFAVGAGIAAALAASSRSAEALEIVDVTAARWGKGTLTPGWERWLRARSSIGSVARWTRWPRGYRRRKPPSGARKALVAT